MRSRLGRIALVAALLCATLALPASPASAATQGTAAWYWPTGSESFGMGGWWQYRGGNWHLAQDMKASCGSNVYAVGAGTVLESKYVARFGPGGSSGGAVVILHKTADGHEFKALYGHLKDLKYSKGDKVAAGAVIGKVNGSSPNHLHFGIHPGRKYPSDNNPFRGHTYTSKNAYGWVDPVKYLREHPRVIPYVAPPLPVVMSRATTVTPTGVVVAGGEVYWRQQSAEATSAWRQTIAGGAIARLPFTAPFPTSEAARYAVALSSAPPRIAVSDKLPVIALKAATLTPRYNASTAFTGSVRNAAGQPFQGASVVMQRWSGSQWAVVARGLTDRYGSFRLTYAPRFKSQMRVVFGPPKTYLAAQSSHVVVTPMVSMSTPVRSVASPAKGAKFKVTSALLPKHSSSAKVEFQLERCEDGKWVRKAAVAAKLSDGGTNTVCTASVSCGSRGSWRIRTAMPADGAHSASCTKWMSFTVK